MHFAEPDTLGGHPDHVGPTTVLLEDGSERQIDVVVTADDGAVPSERTILAVGEAKAGELMTEHHLHRLEEARRALGERAAGARLLLFGTEAAPALTGLLAARTDVGYVGLDRLYAGS